jgi:hypothetical protein
LTVVATGSMLVVATEVVQAPNDKQQLAPMLDKLSALTDHLGDAETLLATAVITGDIRRQHGRQPPFHPLARQKKPLIGNSAQRIKACRAVIGLGPMSQLGHFQTSRALVVMSTSRQ